MKIIGKFKLKKYLNIKHKKKQKQFNIHLVKTTPYEI